MRDFGKAILICAAALISPAAAKANVYLFEVTCSNDKYVAQWESGDADPGKEHFRIATGDVNLDCSIYDYNPKTDRDMPRRWCSDPNGVVRGFPPILILIGYSHCR
ncbi:conserved exported hypothetical protein [Methylocella tundrae]|uniref:Uncharacterized protein n=1 Tax=Methylocella tundrae TaxID=227605 RepID=A0A8B6M683_METTU|nr:hypothetical protein [Methylocella tundrae]VTZ25746.1 conserved exported hypothetical protein [Methylocella tundrae]VTZ49602.1 conserved exported hypothetical protein [Methylocella tundrae]